MYYSRIFIPIRDDRRALFQQQLTEPSTLVTVRCVKPQIQYSESYDATVAHTFTHLSSPTYPTMSDMSCTLLEKLAVETRLSIYEYVLTFDTPVKHVNKMRPFVGKLSGAGSGSGLKQVQSTIVKELTKAGSRFGVRAKAVQGSEPSDFDGSLRRIDTSILTTCKLVYKEAITVFYTSNIIRFEPQLCRREDITHPRGTDLSLATQMVIKIDQPLFLTHIRPHDFWDFALLMLPKLLPNLRTGTIYVPTDSAAHFIAELRILHGTLYRNAIALNAPGSMVATFYHAEPCVKLIMQSEHAMRRWKSPIVQIPADLVTMHNAAANLLFLNTRAGLTDPQNRYAGLARTAFDFTKTLPELDPGSVELDSWEFWTVVDAGLSLFQSGGVVLIMNAWVDLRNYVVLMRQTRLVCDYCGS
jgi:hypothetical protein